MSAAAQDAESSEKRVAPVKLRNITAFMGELEIPGDCFLWEVGNALPDIMPSCKKRIKLKHNKKWAEYDRLFCGFDIETTNKTVGEKHLAFMYHWQFAIANDCFINVFTGRTWEAFLDFMNDIERFYQLNEERRLLIWIANTGFEFQFFRKLFEWDPEDFFAREERHPLKCRTNGFEFHEALSISGGSLAQLAKDYTTTQKLVGDLDYSIERNSHTPIISTELSYNINDVVILAEWSRFIFDNYIEPDKRIPLTKTGILRCETRQNGEKMLTPLGFKQYRSLIYEIFPNEETYAFWFRYLFRGGYVHSNVNLTGFVVPDADGYDIRSSYPTEMLLKDNYPISKFKAVPFDPALLTLKACIIRVRFHNIRRRFSISIESKSKCIALDKSKEYPVIIDNGRVAMAGVMEVVLTELDYENYKQFYIWDSKEVLSFEVADRGKLPPFIRQTLSKYYIEKANLKEQGMSDTSEYVIAKQKVNSFYGMMVTRIELDKITYEDDWIIQDKELDYNEEIKSQFLAPQWGIWVCANARRSLLSATWEITNAIGDGSGDGKLSGVIYNDTDSIKVADPDWKAAKVIEKYNERVRKLRTSIKALDRPEFEGLGEFEHEAHYEKFKTLGAKRYLVSENGKVKATVAGLPKLSILKIDGDPFEAFNMDGMELQAETEIKNTISYNDEPTEAVIDGELMHEQSSAGIYNIGFTMTLDKAYYALIVEAAEDKIRKYGD